MTGQNNYILRCPGCGTKNRIPGEKAGITAKCGKCGNLFPTDILNTDYPVIITDANFQSEVIKSPLPVLLDCWAPWCGPCQMVGPIMEELAKEWKGKIRIGKLNVDENQIISGRYGIKSIPMFLVFDNGKLVNTLVGALPKNAFKEAMSVFLT